MRYHYRLWGAIVGSLAVVSIALLAQRPENSAQPKVVIDDDGTVHVPTMEVPLSTFLSAEAKAYVTRHLQDMQRPAKLAPSNGVPPLIGDTT